MTDLTCLLVHLPPGTHVEKHTHECEDIVYVIKGQAKVWIEGIIDIQLVDGTFVRIPKAVSHQPPSIEEDFIAYDDTTRFSHDQRQIDLRIFAKSGIRRLG